MAHDVFISHALKDINCANAICEKLESSQVRCWIAGRDISVGDQWSEAIRKAIGSSRIMVLLLSENANAATHLEREIAHAYYAKRTILPVRLTETPPRREFLFYLGNVRWFDAFDAPIDQHLGALLARVHEMMQGHAASRDALPFSEVTRTRQQLDFQDFRPAAFQASRSRGRRILKRLSIALILFCALCLFWFLYSRWKGEEFSPEDNRHAAKSVSAGSPDSTGRAAADASPSQPAYAYTRLGLWVASSASPTPPVQEGSRAAPSATITEGAAPEVDHETKSLRNSEGSNVKAAQETPPPKGNQPAPLVEAASPTNKNEPAGGEPLPGKLARVNPRPAATPLATPLVSSPVPATPSVASNEVQNGSRPTSEEEFLKKLVLDYMQTVASDDDSAQERFFSWRVNFYGKGLLSLPEARASMARYRQEWTIRNWIPRGEPEYPKVLHSIHPELYEVLQPFDWTLASGSHHKNGRATLYVRIRKDDQGQFHIIHLEQRGPENQRENTPE
jgi:TIR domain-containing protein